MSWQPSNDPVLGDPKTCDALELVIVPRTRDLGDGFEVRRALPHGKRQMVGPFIFFDHFGPVQFIAGKGMDVRPHPHIGLATVTYLFDGSDHAPRQRGQHPGDPARRDEPDDGRPRHRAFRAHARRAAPRRPEDAGPAELDRAAGRHPRRSRRRSSIMPPKPADGDRRAASPRASSRARSFGVTSPVTMVSPWFYTEVTRTGRHQRAARPRP